MTIPALPDSERLTSYTVGSPSTGPFSVGFAIYGDDDDYQNWIEVWDDGIKLTGAADWTLSSIAGGADLSIIARPITDAQITFTTARSGIIEIVGARRPRQASQFVNGQSITADQHNRRYTDLMAICREFWDRFQRAGDSGAAAAARDLLTGNRTYYVRTDGSDSNTGLVDSAGGAFLTIQKAVDVISETLDVGGKTVTVQVRDGTYTGAVTLKNATGFGVAGTLVIQGNSGTPANVDIHVTSDNCFKADGLSSVWDIKDLKVRTTTSGSCLWSANNSHVRFSNLDFGACATHHMRASNGGILEATGNCAISGGATSYHLHAADHGLIVLTFRTFTLSGTPAFTRFANAQSMADIEASVVTYAGTGATGQRYNASLNAVINSNGGGANFFPGDSAGATATGGQYA